MSNHARNRLQLLLATSAAVLLVATLIPSDAGSNKNKPRGPAVEVTIPQATSGEEFPLDEAQIYFELNDTDGDIGIHGKVDGDAWAYLKIEDPNERAILSVLATGRMRRQGMTEFFFESDEPNFDELPPAEFFRRFPEGEYEIEAVSLDGDELEGSVELSHILAAPPENITFSGTPAPENCDATDIPTISGPLVIAWDPVETHHPTLGKAGDVEIERYVFIVELRGQDPQLVIDLPPSTTEFEVPADFLALGHRFKFELIARTSTGNNTAVETCFFTP